MVKTSEVYSKLYHYTSWDGLIGILDSHSLWATHYKFLNDSSEGVLFKEELFKLLKPKCIEIINDLQKKFPDRIKDFNELGNLVDIAEHDTRAFINAQYTVAAKEFYITSFCGIHKENPYINENGLLSQWRGYGADGGVAIVFDTKALEELNEKEFNRFEYLYISAANVIYSNQEDELKNEFSDSLSSLTEHMKRVFNAIVYDEFEDLDSDGGALTGFLNCITRYKHQGFSEENEVRLVTIPAAIDDKIAVEIKRESNVVLKPEKERKFRSRKGEHIPYIELFDSPDITLPIERIIVGPHKEKENRAQALRIMLRNKNIQVTTSDIPYVG